MAEVNGKWAAYELNGTGFHSCKQQQQQKREPVVVVNGPKGNGNEKDKEWEPSPEAKAWVREIMEGPKLKELDDRLRRVEKMLFQEGT